MRTRSIVSIGMALLVITTLTMPHVTEAQSPAALPMQTDVLAGQPSPIDGVWTISTLDKRIRIEGGRAYALDPWVHAVFWQIQPDMVVLNNVQRLDAGAYIADDLPLAGKAKLKLRPDGDMDVKVSGTLFPVKYRLRKNSTSDPSAFAAELSQTDFSNPNTFTGVGSGSGAAVETWQAYVKYSWCTGTNAGFVKDVTGYISVKAAMSSDSSRSRTSKRKKINSECKTKKRFKKSSYTYSTGDAGFLVLTGTRDQIADYSLRYSLEFWYGRKGKKTQTSHKVFNKPDVFRNGLELMESKDYTRKIDGKMSPDIYVTVRLRRVK